MRFKYMIISKNNNEIFLNDKKIKLKGFERFQFSKI